LSQDGRFQREVYFRYLRMQGMSPTDFEDQQRDRLLVQKVEELVTSSLHADEAGARELYGFTNERVDLAFVRVKASDLAKEIEPSDPEVAKYYEEHREMFREPDRVAIDYVSYDEKDFEKSATVTDAEVEQEYTTNKTDKYTSPEEVHVRHILFQLPRDADAKKRDELHERAKATLERLKKGEDFAALAKELSDDAATKDKGGDLGAVGKSGFFGSLGRQQALADSAWKAPLNVAQGPVKTGLGWHVYEVTEKLPAKPRPLEEMKGVIVRQLTQQSNEDFYKQSLAQEKLDLHLRVDSAAVGAVVNAKKSAVEMFRDAGEIPGADERVTAYRAVVTQYPESEYAPQALFMVGFVESEEKRDYDHAEESFRELVQKYPNSELVSSAQWMLANMRSDKTPNFDLPGDLGKASDHDAPQRESAQGKPAPTSPAPGGTTGKP